MENLLTPSDLAERYRCSTRTARRYMRRMEHMENPLRVTEKAVLQWEYDRTMGMGYDLGPVRKVKPKKAIQNGPIYISRIRPEVKA